MQLGQLGPIEYDPACRVGRLVLNQRVFATWNLIEQIGASNIREYQTHAVDFTNLNLDPVDLEDPWSASWLTERIGVNELLFGGMIRPLRDLGDDIVPNSARSRDTFDVRVHPTSEAIPFSESHGACPGA